MAVVHKYVLDIQTVDAEEPAVLDLPRGARPIHFAFQDRTPAVWGLVPDPNARLVTWRYRIAATGFSEIESGLEYVGTATVDWLVWHLFMENREFVVENG